MFERQHRQGDVLLNPVRSAPKGKAIAPDNGRVILAYGEVTGHAHAIEEIQSVALIETEDGHVYLRVKEEVPLRHEEHQHPRNLHVHDYEVIQQCEELAGDVRQVLD